MRFGVLGPLTAWTAGDHPVTIPGRKVRALLADLLAHDGRPVPADRLIDDLWAGRPPANATGALSAKISQLRRALDDAHPGARTLLAAHPAGYRLHIDPTTADHLRFTDLLTKARTTTDPHTKATRLTDALALWRGPAFADFHDEPFLRPTITRLEEQHLTAREEHAETRLHLGEHTQLADELTELLRHHPLRERLRATHMRALYRSGRQSEALDSYHHLRDHLADELGLDPSAHLTRLHHAILTHDPTLDTPAPPPAPRPPTAPPPPALPLPLTPLIGRDDALTAITTQLTTSRLVTLTGPGGVGKTRLALETATRLAPTYPDGVHLVELAALDHTGTTGTLTAVANHLTTTLGIRDTTGTPTTPLDRLTTTLRDRTMLLILDNCEHLIDHAAHLTTHLLRTAPGLRVLATSQEPLAIPGETVWNVPPLDVPTPGHDPRHAAAVQLFTQRATAATRDFTLDDTTTPAVATLCRRLDGIPLALELAATKVPALGVHGLVARLDDRFRLLATGHRGAPPRQQTLTAMIDWSFELLTPDEQTVLRRLAVHADGCTLDTAEATTSGPGLPPTAVPAILTRLVDRSLLTATHTPDGPRYRLLESVAHYCTGHLHHTGELPELRTRHLHHYTTLAETAAPHLHGPRQRHWLHHLDTETPNLRLALDTALTTGHPTHALRLTTALTWYWFLRGRLTEARTSLHAALTTPTTHETTSDDLTTLRALATTWHTGITLMHGTPPTGTPPPTGGDPTTLARARWFHAYAAIDTGDLTTTTHLLHHAHTAFTTTGDHWGNAAVHLTHAKLAHLRGDLTALDHHARHAATTFHTLGDTWGHLQATGWLGAHAEMTGDHTTANRLHHDSLHMARQLDLWPDIAGELAWLGWIAMQQADYTTATDLCHQAATLATSHGYHPLRIFAEMGLGFTARKAGHLDTAETHLRTVLDTTPGDHTPAPHLPMVHTELGYLAELRGDPTTARTHHLHALTLAERFDAPREKILALEGLAGALTLTGHHTHAAHLLGAAHTLRTTTALPPAPAEQTDINRITTRARHALGDTPYTQAHHHGTTLTPHQTTTLATTPPT